MRFLRLGSAGMRGEIGSGLTPPDAIRYASAFGTWLEGSSVAIASDTRISSPMLRGACLSGLLGCGCKVFDAGICPAPLLHFTVPESSLHGALLIGAGHHPAGWNAMVPLDSSGAYLNSTQTQELLDIYHSGLFKRAKWDSMGKLRKAPDGAAGRYIERLCSMLDTTAIAAARFRVVADFCNGSGSAVAAMLAKRLGVELVSINDNFSGFLPHDPEPRPRSSSQAKSLVAPLKAHAGFVFNSDMSRSAIVTDSGETLSEEYSFPIVADHILSKIPAGSKVVTNCCTTRTLDELAARHGASVLKVGVGQAPIMDAMTASGAALAGDGSGSVAVQGGAPGFDAFAVMAFTLEAMALGKCTSSDLAAKLPRYHIVKRSIPCRSSRAYTLLHSLRNSFPDAAFSDADGIRFDWKDGWIHLRASMTEPIVRMIVEWRGREEAEDRASHMRSTLERLVAS